MPSDLPHIAQVQRLSKVLDDRVKLHARIEPYYENESDEAALPSAITEARLTKVYRLLMPVAEAPWGSLVVDSKLDRLEVSGISDPVNSAAADAAWGVWQDCHMDAESKLAHGAALLDGRCCATVWRDKAGQVDIALDDITQMVVEYEPGSRHKRMAAMRRWKEGERVYATLYRPEGLYKYQSPDGIVTREDGQVVDWEQRTVEDEKWPAPNIFPNQEIPVVELRVNGRLKPGSFPHARGEFAHCTGLIDRINLLTFLGLLVALRHGFPLRGVIGARMKWGEVLKDDDGNPIMGPDGKEKREALPPFDAQAGELFQFEDPDTKIVEYAAADRKNLSIFAELDQLAVITKTARHYFPLEQGMSNLSAEAIVASEGGMLAAVTGHKASLGEGHEEILRLGGKLLDPPVELSQRAEMEWKKHESRSLAEQADAYVKLAQTLPWMAAAELALNATKDQISRWESEAAGSAITKLIEAAKQPVSGNGVPGGVPAV